MNLAAGIGALDRALRKIENGAAIFGGTMMVLAMVLTSLDALLRYSLNAPIKFTYYFAENYLMVCMVALPLAWGFREGGYVRIVLLIQFLAAGPRNLLLRAGLLVSTFYIVALAWFSWLHFLDVYRRGDVQMGVFDWPVAWSWFPIPIGLALLAARLLVTAFGPGGALHAEYDDTVEHKS